MQKSLFQTETLQFGDEYLTPISVFVKLRQIYSETALLECAETISVNSASSFVCADEIATFKVKNGVCYIEKFGKRIFEKTLSDSSELNDLLDEFRLSIKVKAKGETASLCGLFGYIGFSAIPYFEDIKMPKVVEKIEDIPDLSLSFYRYVFRFDHFRRSITALKIISGKNDSSPSLEKIIDTISAKKIIEFCFKTIETETAEISDQDFIEIVEECRKNVKIGEVFQIVPSRKFFQRYKGDEFQVYKALRKINPSPYLFFFDFGEFSLFGSSPEAQLVIKNNVATINPIAGTYRRGINAKEDQKLARQLANDPKEIAEHTMLVDLARNDLGKNCQHIKVEKFKEVEFFSRVIHLVSRVSGKVNPKGNLFKIFADTFPAGTLSGAPKYRALELIHEMEKTSRSFYGGSVGFFNLDGKNCTQALMIRSFLAKDRTLVYQAGAGVVDASIAENENAEVRNKLAALRKAITEAENL